MMCANIFYILIIRLNMFITFFFFFDGKNFRINFIRIHNPRPDTAVAKKKTNCFFFLSNFLDCKQFYVEKLSPIQRKREKLVLENCTKIFTSLLLTRHNDLCQLFDSVKIYQFIFTTRLWTKLYVVTFTMVNFTNENNWTKFRSYNNP